VFLYDASKHVRFSKKKGLDINIITDTLVVAQVPIINLIIVSYQHLKLLRYVAAATVLTVISSSIPAVIDLYCTVESSVVLPSLPKKRNDIIAVNSNIFITGGWATI